MQAEVLARLAALGVDTGTAVPEALPAAKHIFSHIEWLLSGVALTVPEQAAPAGCVWASREELRTTYTLPGAFAAYKDRMLAICPKLFVQNGQEAKKLPATVVIFDRNGYNNHKIAGKRTVPEVP